MSIKILRGFPIEIEEEELKRILGYRRGELPQRVRAIVEEARELCKDLLSPACIYRYMEKEELALSDYLKGTESAALCLVTIGPGVEKMVDEMKARGDLSRALVLDAYGSSAAEASAAAAEEIIRSECLARGTNCSRRFSPGFGGWDVSEQKWILNALQAEKLNVTLTEGCMMVPRKSITFAVNVCEDTTGIRRNQCDICGLANCRFKHPKAEEEKENE